MNLIQVFKMLSILLFLSFTKIKANSVNNLPTNLEKLWISSQVLIYHNPETFKDFSIQEPDCFGNALTKYHVITAASCFIKLNYKLQCLKRDCKTEKCKDIDYHQSDTKQNQINLQLVYFQSIKKSIYIEETLIAQVS